MEQLPYIDEHAIDIAATPERVWRALASVLRTDLGGAASVRLTRVLGLAPVGARGDWHGTIRPGDTLPGFAVAEIDPPKRMVLCGGHRFSRYALAFELASDGDRCTLRAHTRAEFPGRSGRTYRALVIGTGAHRLVVRRLLRNVARRA
jgi:hypothetical protein